MRRLIVVLLLILLTSASILYLIPSFEYAYQGKRYVFENVPSALNNDSLDLRIRIPRITSTYVYEIESAAKLDKKEDWNKLSADDQKILAQRLESVIGGAYEIRLDNRNNKVAYTIFTNRVLPNTTLLTETNSSFILQSVSSTSVTTTTGETPNETKTDLPLKRDDFGFGEIVATKSNESQITYAVRMPLGILITPEKIETIKKNLISQLTINIAGKDYQASFDYNTSGTPTHLVVYAGSTAEDALLLKAFVNSQSMNLGYELKNASYTQNDKLIYILFAVLLIVLAVGYAVNYFTVKNISWKKALLILSLSIIYIASFKLLNITLTLAPLLLLLTVISLTFFNLRPIYYIVFASAVVMLKLLGLLNGFDLSWLGLMVTLLVGILIWITNYVEFIQKENK